VKPFTSQGILEVFRGHAAIPPNTSCPTCGAALVYRQARLSIYETDEAVTISIGFCEWCDGLPATQIPVH
jgi:hypothetical protein